VLGLLAAAAFGAGYVRHRQLLHPEFPAHHLRSLMAENSDFYLEGSLRQEPEKLPNRNRWLISAERIWHPTGAEDVTGDILVNVRRVRREWRYGDRVRFWVRPVAPRDSGNPGGFNYATYLSDREIYATGFLENDGEVELLARQPSMIRGAVESLRREIRRYIDQNISRENGPLLKALTVGDMGEISKEMRTEFTAAGVNHVISISGLHVGMLGLVIFTLIRYGCGFNTYLLLRFNLVKIATFCSFLAVVFYTALAGAMVPTVRSAIMIGVYELAVLLDREEEVLTSLTLAALLIALVWPGVITDISFQLSFLAVLFIAWGIRQVRDWFPARPKDELPQERSRWRPIVRQAGLHLAVPVLATIGTGPLIAHYFGHLSLAGFLSNPVIVPLVGFIVVPLGLLIAFLSLTFPVAATPLLWLEEHLTSLTTWLVQLFANLPLANISVPAPDRLEIAALYLLFLTLLLVRKSRSAPLALAIMVTLLVGDGVYWWGERWNRRELRVTHLNVGQGDAAVVELPGSKVLLIDAGGTATGEFDTGEAIVAPFLRARKILKVDYLMVSHAKIDHYGGMQTIVKEFAPEEFWSSPAKGKTGRFDDLEEALEQGRIKRVMLHSYEPCRTIDGVELCVLYPAQENTNDGSVVLRLEYGKVRFLFAGDIEKRDERLLQARSAELQSAILKVPRHGSATASSDEFVAAVQPKFAVFSRSAGSQAAASRDEVLSRYRQAGAEILRTDEDGAIIFESDGSTLRYSSYKSGKRGIISF
ncbi:MAG: DNA internalization-related competence protein ComEC/Rec2, partial [Deltaproteobacteria bacterium]